MFPVLIGGSGNKQTQTLTDTQDEYCNPLAHVKRVINIAINASYQLCAKSMTIIMIYKYRPKRIERAK